MAVRGRGRKHRLLVDALAIGVAALLYLLAPQVTPPARACDPVTGEGCDMGPPPTNPPQTQPPETQPPDTQPFVTSPPETTPPGENFDPNGPVTYKPKVPAVPAENFVPGDGGTPPPDGDTPPDVQLTNVPPDDPQPEPAPPPPAPPPPTPPADSPLGLGLAGAGGILAADTVKKKEGRYDLDRMQDGMVEMGAGVIVYSGTAYAIGAGAIAIGSSAVVGPVLVAVATGLFIVGFIDFITPAPRGVGSDGGARG